MCVIIAMETKIPSLEVFEQCEKKNPHGGGISWVANGKVHYKKGIEAHEAYDIAVHFGPPCIAHFRISTVGGKPKSLTHPFVVSKKSPLDLEGECDSVLFHNGHWHNWEKTCFDMVLNKNAVFPIDEMSDSRAMAWITGHCNPSWLGMIGQKVVVQTHNSRQYFGEWQEVDDVYYSNLHWQKVARQVEWWKDDRDPIVIAGKEKEKVLNEALKCDSYEASEQYLRDKGYMV